MGQNLDKASQLHRQCSYTHQHVHKMHTTHKEGCINTNMISLKQTHMNNYAYNIYVTACLRSLLGSCKLLEVDIFRITVCILHPGEFHISLRHAESGEEVTPLKLRVLSSSFSIQSQEARTWNPNGVLNITHENAPLTILNIEIEEATTKPWEIVWTPGICLLGRLWTPRGYLLCCEQIPQTNYFELFFFGEGSIRF